MLTIKHRQIHLIDHYHCLIIRLHSNVNINTSYKMIKTQEKRIGESSAMI